MKICGIILAGGQSRRMGGREKSLMELQNIAPIEWVARRLQSQVDKMAVNANGDPRRFDFLDLPVLPDTIEGFVGPLAGVLTGMRWAAGTHDATHIVTAAADTPFIPSQMVQQLSSHLTESNRVSMAHSNGRIHPVAALWPCDLADALERFLIVEDQRKILVFAQRYGLAETKFNVVEGHAGHDPFFNINTPDDMAIAEQIASGLKQ